MKLATQKIETVAGLTRAELDKVEQADFAKADKRDPKQKIRDAATLILLDRSAGKPQVLMGRRSMKHAFMPGRFVFPGGRTDPADSRVPCAAALHPQEEARLMTATRISAARARAIAMSAVRETYEEAGLLLGKSGDFATQKADWQGFVTNSVMPSLDQLRFVARAITPPGRVRRFDTRFFAAWRDDVAVALPDGGPTQELEELVWLPIAEAKEMEIPPITRSVLSALEERLVDDPQLSPGGRIPFFRMLHNRFQLEQI